MLPSPKSYFGSMTLDEIDDSVVAQFRAKLVKDKLSEKRINSILAVLSKSLRYAARVRLIEHAPEMGLYRVDNELANDRLEKSGLQFEIARLPSLAEPCFERAIEPQDHVVALAGHGLHPVPFVSRR